MKKRIIRCYDCQGLVALGQTPVERFYPNKKDVWIFHRENCYERFMTRLMERRQRDFEEELVRVQGRRYTSIYDKCSVA